MIGHSIIQLKTNVRLTRYSGY